MQPKQQSSKKKLLSLMIILALIAGGFAWWRYSQPPANEPAEQPATSQQNFAEEPVEPTEFQGSLFPSLSFIVPNGWSVDEPADYGPQSFDGGVDTTIAVSDGSVSLQMGFKTALATGFTSALCGFYPDITPVGDTHRMTLDDGVISYRNGITPANDDWDDVVNGEFVEITGDQNPNFCVIIPIIRSYESTRQIADFPETPFASYDNEYVIGWLTDVFIDGDPSDEQVADIDTVIASLSSSNQLISQN
jgi:hypothetical protein